MTTSSTNTNIRNGRCLKHRRSLSAKGPSKRNPKTHSHATRKALCRKERSNKSHGPKNITYPSGSNLSQAQWSEKKKPVSKESKELNSAKAKMAIDALLNPFEQNLQDERQAAPLSGVPLVQLPIIRDPSSNDNALASVSESSENFQGDLFREDVADFLLSYIQNPLADSMSLQIEESHQPITPALPEEWNTQAVSQNVESKDMEIEELMCTEDELDGGSDSETTLTAPLNEEDLYSLLDDIVSMDEVLHVLDLYDPEGFDTTSGIFPTVPEDYPMTWNTDSWNDAGIFSLSPSFPPSY